MSEKAAVPKPLPRRDGLAGEFYERCAKGRLAFQRCEECGRFRHPPRALCPGCSSERAQWVESSRRGRIHTWTVVHQAMHPAFAPDAPYAVVVTELEEGVRLVSGIRDMKPDDLALDLPVEVVLVEAADGLRLPCVRPRPA